MTKTVRGRRCALGAAGVALAVACAVACGAPAREAEGPAGAPAGSAATIPPPAPSPSAATATRATTDSAAPAVGSAPPSATAGPCEGKCTGGATPELQAAATDAVKKTRRCYETALASDPSVAGALDVEVRLAADGAVCATTVKKSALPPAVDECVTKMLGATRFPAPAGGCITMVVPIRFVSAATQGNGAGASPRPRATGGASARPRASAT